MREVDYIIVGQGLAGTCLAWELRELGASVLVIDREAEITSSRIAAGLITPITGQRLVKSWRFEELRAAAWEFYRRMESELECSLLRETLMVKVFATPQERESFEKRVRHPEYTGFLSELAEPPTGISAPLGSCQLLQGGQLSVAEFLRRSRERFQHAGCYQSGELSFPDDLVWAGDHVEIPCRDLRTRTLVFCQGFEARHNPWFSPVEFNPARGEMLVVRIPGWSEDRIIHGGVWIAPLGSPAANHDQLYRVGATYDWQQLASEPTPEGRATLIESLDRLLKVPYSIVDHQTAVRPILKQLYPMLGRHPRYPQLGYYNGLASKGSLQAPYFAKQFASHLVHGTSIDREVDLQVRVPQLGADQ